MAWLEFETAETLAVTASGRIHNSVPNEVKYISLWLPPYPQKRKLLVPENYFVQPYILIKIWQLLKLVDFFISPTKS
jgi:hypothetical protein